MSTIVRTAPSVRHPLLHRRAAKAAVPASIPVPTVERTGDQRLGRAVVIGCAIGVVGMTALAFGMGMIAGFGAGASLALGLFCAIWGGLGFGSMFASVFIASREEQRERDAGPDAPPSNGMWF